MDQNHIVSRSCLVAGVRSIRSLERMPRSPDAVSRTLESLLQRYRESVLRIGRRHGLSDQLLDEAIQELRIRLWRAFPGSDQLAAVSPGYLYRAAVTAALMVIRRRRAKRESGIEMTPRFEETTPARAPSRPGVRRVRARRTPDAGRRRIACRTTGCRPTPPPGLPPR